MPKAFARSFLSSKRAVTIDRVEGERTAAKTPCSARAAMSQPPLVALPPTADMMAKPVIPTMKVRLGPKRSANAAAEEEQTAERQGVGRDDPLAVGRRHA